MFGTKLKDIWGKLLLSRSLPQYRETLPFPRVVGFKLWAAKGMWKMGDLQYIILSQYLSVSDKYNLGSNHFFKFFQLRNFIRTQQDQSLSIPPLSSVEKAMTGDCLGRGVISKIYDLLVAESSESSVVKRLEAWREALHDDITISDWEWVNQHTSQIISVQFADENLHFSRKTQ